MTLYEKIKKIEKFLRPSRLEFVIYFGSWPISIITAHTAYAITKDVYSICAAIIPQGLEYLFFRLGEAGVFGRNLKKLIKNTKI